jgi:ribosomal protein S6
MPLYDITMLTKVGKNVRKQTGDLLKQCAGELWKRGAVMADIQSWGQRELAYRIRAQGTNHYHAQFLSMQVYCSPPALRAVEKELRTSDVVLRWMPQKLRAVPPLDSAARFPHRRPQPPLDPTLEGDPIESAK